MSAKKESVWKSFVTPGWIIAFLLALAFSWFAITWLSPWQLGKDHDIVERNDRIEAAFDADPVPAGPLLDSYDPADEWTRVILSGRYLAEDEVLLRMRPVDSSPAFQSLVPFALDGGQVILVNRGWVPAEAGGTSVPPLSPVPSETVTLNATIRTPEEPSPDGVIEDQGYTMVQSISPSQVGSLSGTTLVEPYAQLLSDQPGVLNPIPLPKMDRGNHLSYGLQWIAFGIMAPAGLIYFLFTEVRERRRYRSEQEELAAMVADDPAYGAGPPVPPATTAAQEAAQEASQVAGTPPSAPARARYGSARKNPWADKGSEERF